MLVLRESRRWTRVNKWNGEWQRAVMLEVSISLSISYQVADATRFTHTKAIFLALWLTPLCPTVLRRMCRAFCHGWWIAFPKAVKWHQDTSMRHRWWWSARRSYRFLSWKCIAVIIKEWLKFVDMTVLDTQQFHFEDESTLGRNNRRVATFTLGYMSSYISNCSVCNANSPYARWEGMVNLRFSEIHISRRPWSQPLMTCPAPTKSIGQSQFLKLVKPRWQGGHTRELKGPVSI